jgi:calcineurin-like phosphoesterase family protein
MDAAMVARWNEVVGPQDEVWHLGDFGMGCVAPSI